MSSSSEFSGQRQARTPDKPSFSQTCSLLSQYLKEKGSFGDLSLGMTCSVEPNGSLSHATTMNLFPVNEKPDDVSGQNMASSRNLKSMELFPQQAGFFPSALKEDGLKMSDSSVNKSAVVEPQTAQMTIFYGGQVIVFNDFPADKARDIMLLAGKSSQRNNSFPSNLATTNTSTPFASGVAKSPVELGGGITSAPNVMPNFGNNLTQDCVQAPRPPTPIASDLPIARRASLHRFLEKRKDRITTRAPYQASSSAATPLKPGESKLWLGLAAQSPQQ